MKVCYLILHYKNINDTIKCMDSLANTAGEDSSFVIVDNGSGDGSGEKLLERYGKHPKCHVILLEENLGYSKGNNVGYQLIREEMKPDYLVVTNNDIVFEQLDFEKKIDEIYKRTGFHLLGPDIFIPWNKEHASPLFGPTISIEALEADLQEYIYYEKNPEQFIKRLKAREIKNRLCSQSKIIRVVYNKLRGKEDLDYTKERRNVGVQGACLIVSKKYIEQEEKMFDPEPFLYCEEVLMYFKCKKKQYEIVYSPELKVLHEESASFKNENKNMDERIRFMLKHYVISKKMVLDYLTQEN